MPRPDPNRNLTRIGEGDAGGWWVRIQRDGTQTQRSFRDARHGGTDGALKAARRWRNARLRELGPAQTSDASRMHTPEARAANRRAVSQTGETGIAVQVRPFASQRVPYVTAYWVDEGGRRRQTSFSVAKHGVDGALRLAARARAQTADWHGERAVTARTIARRARDRVRELVAATGWRPAGGA